VAVQPAGPDFSTPGPGAWPGKLVIRYADGTLSEEFFREAPHDAVHLSMLTTVGSACLRRTERADLTCRALLGCHPDDRLCRCAAPSRGAGNWRSEWTDAVVLGSEPD
jgi:hypothetical protein